jgi:hydroxysqualene dehydroxylase
VKPVVIVGGGLAGLAAGVSLSRSNIPVVVLEQRQYAGGRAASFVDSRSQQAVDFGQHVMIAAYRRTLALLETLGTRHLVSIQATPSLPFHHPDRGFCRFSVPGLPGDLGFAAGILATGLFGASDKVRILRAGLSMKALRPERPGTLAGMTVRDWLESHGQTPEAVRSFWEPLTVAIMNEHISSASALVFLRSMKIAFQGGRGGASMVIARVGLSHLFGDPAAAQIRSRGGEVRTGVEAAGTIAQGGRVTGIRLKNNEVVGCAGVILAVPWYRICAMLPDELRRAGFLRAVEGIGQSPIISIHMWFERNTMTEPFLGIVDGTIQWVFNRRQIEGSSAPGGHVSAVISAAGSLVELTADELTALALTDLHRVFGTSIGRPVRSIVVRERRATFSCSPAAEALRPDASTPVENLFLAGDWTATGLPATIEGAIVSGEKAAAGMEAVLRAGTADPARQYSGR